MATRIVVLAAVLWIWIFAGVSNASAGVLKNRVLEEGEQAQNPSSQTPPPAADPASKGGSLGAHEKLPSAAAASPPRAPSDHADEADSTRLNSGDLDPKTPPPPVGASDPVDDRTTNSQPPPLLPVENGKGSHVDTNEGKPGSSPATACHKMPESCIRTDFVACLQYNSAPGYEEQYLLLQNIGSYDLLVNITIPHAPESDAKRLHLAKNESEQISVGCDTSTGDIVIVLGTDKENCILRMGLSGFNRSFYDKLPAMAVQLPPSYALYFLGFAVTVFGGAWACCKFGHLRSWSAAGIPYQQLEMGIRPQNAGVATETNGNGGGSSGLNGNGDGWDQWNDWGDDEDEESILVEPPEKRPAGNASTNGIAPRPAKKHHEWDADWDD